MDLEQRVARLEGAYEHLATKADVAEIKTDIAEIKGSFETLLVLMTAILALLNIVLKVFVP